VASWRSRRERCCVRGLHLRDVRRHPQQPGHLQRRWLTFLRNDVLDFSRDVAVTGANATTTFTVTVLPPSGRVLTVFSQEEPEPRFQALGGGAGQRHVRVRRG
jgi:hypothetical protein